MRLICRDYNLIGQILKVLRMKEQKEKKRYSVKGIADEWKYSKSRKKKGDRLTSGTTKLIPISSQGRGSRTWGIGEGGC